jgi:hypothetical protein
MTAVDAGSDATIEGIAEDLQELVAGVRHGAADITTAELAELASRALRLACVYERRSDPVAIGRLKAIAAELAELASGVPPA